MGLAYIATNKIGYYVVSGGALQLVHSITAVFYSFLFSL